MSETTYRANCHCGKFVYEVTFPEPLTKAFVCNCSICTRKAYVHAFEPEGGIKVVKGSIDDLDSYVFGDKYDHKFCGDCGSPVLIMPQDPTKGKSLNVRCFQGPVDVWALEKIPFDGASLDPQFVERPFTGTEPTGEPLGDGPPTIYHGSCHCGAVRVALRSQPLDDTLVRDKQSDRVVECDCSICQRNGYRWFYPKADQVSVHDPEGVLKFYSFGKFINKKSFCGKCGVAFSNLPTNLSAEEIAKLPPMAQTPESDAWRKRIVNMSPINTRVLYGVDLDKLPVKESPGYTLIPGEYVNP
ncbi:hypothetical protein SEUCBS139899_009138 [Sporothrix eucalyptigena]|uniref:CENP-V/GFA domain-containing protein n=1 Tax=Sporothrix eucalyptigena TaxID=1812306 RepID=A0ABP0CSB6_9PEZI